MPPRPPSRADGDVGNGSVLFPSPQRPQSRQDYGRSASPGPSALYDPPVALHHNRHSCTPTAASRIDYSRGSSAVSESISKAYFHDVVLETDADASHVDQESLDVLLQSLGSVVVDHNGAAEDDDEDPSHSGMPRSGSGSSINAIASTEDRSRAASAPTNPGRFDLPRFQGRVQELIDTERSYVRRIEALHQKYAVPLLRLAKDRDTAIISIYEAQRLFGNIGGIVGANKALLMDLEALAAKGIDAIRSGLGDIAYRHISCFDCYTEYFSNFEKAKYIESSLAKHRGFQEFVDRTKYSMTGLGNVGLRDLLMEPIQRIPRYKLLFDGIIKCMDSRDPQRGRLEDAVVKVSRIASCEADDKTKRAAVLWSFSRNVDEFPAGLISVHRQFVDSVDVDDFPLEALGAPAGSVFTPGASVLGSGKTIHCTLFLFDDRLAVVKRASAGISGRKAVGLDDLNKLADQMKTFTERSSSTILSGGRKGDLGFRGVVNILDLEALDLGGSDFQLNFLRAPSQVSGDKWTGRPVRQYVTADSSSLTGSSARGAPRAVENDTAARLEKTRFLESLWRAQALFKTREHRSHVRCQILPAVRPHGASAASGEAEQRGAMDIDMLVERDAEARRVIYWNVYTRRSYLAEPHKAPLALHVNLDSEADPLPLGPETAPPHAALELIHIDPSHSECQTSAVTKADPETPSDVTVVSCSDLPTRMTQLGFEVERMMGGRLMLHTLSQPVTPSSYRGRMPATLRRFAGVGGGASAAASDIFGSPARRTKSNASKSTAYSSDAPSTSSRAMTFSTNATSVSSRAGMSIMAGSSMSRQCTESPETSFFGSPRRLMKKRRSSSVGPPSMSAEQSPSRGAPERGTRTRGATPEPGYVSAVAAAMEPATNAANGLGEYSATASPYRSSRLGVHGGGHQRAKTESFTASMRSPMSDAADGYGADVSREPSTSTQGSSRHGKTGSNAGVNGTPGSAFQATTPLNIRRKPPPKASDDEEEDVPNDGSPIRKSAARPSTLEGTPGHMRTPSGSKRAVPFDTTPSATKQSKRASISADAGDETVQYAQAPVNGNGEVPGRPSLSESETSTERGHGAPESPQKSSDGPLLQVQPVPKRTTSSVSRQRGVEEARKRARAVEDSVRSIRDEVKRLRFDLDAREEASRTPMRRSVRTGAMQEADLNSSYASTNSTVESLCTLTSELEERLSSSTRMNDRLLAQLLSSSSSSSSSSSAPSSVASNERELNALRLEVKKLTRQCDLLTTLEQDGRMENTELHKAFNEELDAMYEDTQRPEAEELEVLRAEIKRVKRQRNDLSVKAKKLHLDLELERVQSSTYKQMLEDHGLL